MSYRILSWDDEEARLKGFSSSSKSGARSVVKIEIEVQSAYCLGELLRRLEEIHSEQNASHRKAPKAPERANARQRAIASQPGPLLLGYREDGE